MAQERFGPYVIEELIGRGGMGTVHRARDTRKADRIVALKRVPAERAADAEAEMRFRREAELVASLRNQHIIPIHDYGEIDGRLFLDMRLVEGIDLAAHLRARGPLPPALAVTLLEQIASALEAAHGVGLLHRDVKPSNVLLSGVGELDDTDADHSDGGGAPFVYLIDFGIAALVDDPRLTRAGYFAGSPAYTAPERFDSTGDTRSDIYSLGCVLFEMLVGETPFAGPDAPRLMRAHIEEAPPRPTERRPGTPRGFDDVVATALAKAPGDRPPRARALAAAARRALVAAPRPAGSTTTVPRSRRTTAPAGAIATGPGPAPTPRPHPPPRGTGSSWSAGVPHGPAGTSGPPRIHVPEQRGDTRVGAPLPPPAAGPPERRRRPGLWSGAAVLTIVLIVGVGLYWMSRPTADPSTAPAAAGPPTVAPVRLVVAADPRVPSGRPTGVAVDDAGRATITSHAGANGEDGPHLVATWEPGRPDTVEPWRTVEATAARTTSATAPGTAPSAIAIKRSDGSAAVVPVDGVGGVGGVGGVEISGPSAADPVTVTGPQDIEALPDGTVLTALREGDDDAVRFFRVDIAARTTVSAVNALSTVGRVRATDRILGVGIFPGPTAGEMTVIVPLSAGRGGQFAGRTVVATVDLDSLQWREQRVVSGVIRNGTSDGRGRTFLTDTGGDRGVVRLDAQGSEEETGARTPIVDPTDAVVTPDGSILLVIHRPAGDDEPGELVALDSRTLDRLAGVAVGERPSAIALARDGGRAYVTNAGSRTISVVDIAR